MKELKLLEMALIFEQGHPRRTQHILKVHDLTRLLAIDSNVSQEELDIVLAAAILHDIGIGPAKDRFNDACQKNQQSIAKTIVPEFLRNCGYSETMISPVLSLVLHHHDYSHIDSFLLQILIEADLLVNLYESESALSIEHLFKTELGKKLYSTFILGK